MWQRGNSNTTSKIISNIWQSLRVKFSAVIVTALFALMVVQPPVMADEAGNNIKLAEAAPASGSDSKKVQPPPATPPDIWFPAPDVNIKVLDPGFNFTAGIHVMSDYYSRGVSQSAHEFSVTGLVELRYGWFYVGTQLWRVVLSTNPALELDVYGGVRVNWGALNTDIGVIGAIYPRNTTNYWSGTTAPFWSASPQPGVTQISGPYDPSFVEIYIKPSYAISKYLTIGMNVAVDPSWANTGAKAVYIEGNVTVTPPIDGISISGAVGYYDFLTTQDALYAYTVVPSYVSYNVGLSYNWKFVTLDVRYYGSNLSPTDCFILNTNPTTGYMFANGGTPTSNWCDGRVVGTLSFDVTLDTFKAK